MSAFETSLYEYLNNGHKTSGVERKAKRMLARPVSSPSRKRFLANLKRCIEEKNKHDRLGAIDWSSIDWAKLFEQFIALIAALLKMFGG